MAVFTGSPTGSVEYNLQNSLNRAFGGDTQGNLRVARFNYTHTAGAGSGEINLIKLPPGKLIIFSDLSRIVTTTNNTNGLLHIGYRAFGEVPEDDNAFLDNGGATPRDSAFPLPLTGQLALKSPSGVTIFAMIDAGDMGQGDTISGWVVYSRVG